MQDLQSLLNKLGDLAKRKETTILDIDLMLDHTRALYNNLLELRDDHVNRPLAKEQLQEAKDTNDHPVDTPPQSLPQKEIPIESPDKAKRKAFTPPQLTRLQNEGPPKEYFPLKADPDIAKTAKNSLKSIIGVNDKYQFISELFGNNKDAYEEVITELERFDTYDQATNWLNAKVYTLYGWDDDNEAVQSFYFILSQFFASM